MENSRDPDQLASSEASWSGSTLFSKEDISRFNRTRIKERFVSSLFHCEQEDYISVILKGLEAVIRKQEET